MTALMARLLRSWRWMRAHSPLDMEDMSAIALLVVRVAVVSGTTLVAGWTAGTAVRLFVTTSGLW